MSTSKISDFYDQKNVFITGGTGYLGEVLIEKLLRSTNIANVYVLIRPKYGKSVEARFDELLESSLFDLLRENQPYFKNRVTPVSGDCSKPNLGLSDRDLQNLTTMVHIIFHNSATTSFTGHLKTTYEVNVKGVENLVRFSKQVKRLESVVHVSSAYSNLQLIGTIDEIFYDYPVCYQDLGAKLKLMTMEEANEETPSLIHNWPNTYSMCKALGEAVIKETAGDLPVAIFRPAIITSAYKEPFKNWTDSMNGATGIVGACCLGYRRVFGVDVDTPVELVPVDMTAAALIAIPWDSTIRKNGDIPIYNYVSSANNHITCREFLELIKFQFKDYSLKTNEKIPELTVIDNYYKYSAVSFFVHYLPAFLIDTVTVLTLRKPRMVSFHKKMDHWSTLLYLTKERKYNFIDENVKAMWRRMNETDKKIFNFDMDSVHWTEYCRGYVEGLRLYLLKNGSSEVPKNTKKAESLEVLVTVFQYSIYFLGLWKLFSPILFIFLKYVRHQYKRFCIPS